MAAFNSAARDTGSSGLSDATVQEFDGQEVASRSVSRDDRIQPRPANQLRIHLRARRTDHERKQQGQIRPRCGVGNLRVAWGTAHTNCVPLGQPRSSASASA